MRGTVFSFASIDNLRVNGLKAARRFAEPIGRWVLAKLPQHFSGVGASGQDAGFGS